MTELIIEVGKLTIPHKIVMTVEGMVWLIAMQVEICLTTETMNIGKNMMILENPVDTIEVRIIIGNPTMKEVDIKEAITVR